MNQQNDNFYLAEAFQQLKCLNEDAFDLSADKGVVDELQSFVADDIEAPFEEEIIDIEAENEDDLSDNYFDKVVLECASCKAKIFKDISEIFIDEESGLANVEEECPLCGNAFGFNIIGKIEPFEEVEDSEEDTVGDDIGDGGEEVEAEAEFSDEEIGEALKEALNKNCDEEKCEEECDKEECDESLNEYYALGAKDLRGKNITIADYVKANFDKLPGEIAVMDDPDNDRSFYVVSKNYADREHDLIDFVRIEDDINYDHPTAVFYINGAKPQPSLFDESCKNEEKCLDEADKPAAQSIEDAQKWVDYDIKHYGHISNRTNELVKKAGFQIIKDDHGDYEVAVGKYDESCDESLNEEVEHIKDNIIYVSNLNDLREFCKKEGEWSSIELLFNYLDDVDTERHTHINYSDLDNYPQKIIDDLTDMYDGDLDQVDLSQLKKFPKYFKAWHDDDPRGNDESIWYEIPEEEVHDAELQTNLFDESLTEEVEVNINDKTAAEDAVKIEDSEQEPIKEELGDKAVEDAEKLVDPEENPVKESLNEAQHDVEFEVWGRNVFSNEKRLVKKFDNAEEAISYAKELEGDNQYGTYYVMSVIDGKYSSVLKESLKEGIENLSLDTEDQHLEMTSDENGRVEIVTEPKHDTEVNTETSEEEMIAPLSDEDKDAIMGNDGEMPEEEEAPVEDEFAVDDFDEESFDELGESFLRRVYENVDSFNTTKATEKDGKLVVEGLIKFNSGKEKATSFVFENFKNTKRGKVLVTGLNETFSKSNRAFLLKGTLSDKKFVSESLVYNYTVSQLNESNENESIRVYGRAVVKK